MATGRWTGALATALLVAMAALLLATHFWPGPAEAKGLIRAGAEAAIAGGLADWFAVVALFRRPLGLPIPHTAVIARGKDRIAAGLGQFVERHFLDPALVAERIDKARLSAAGASWLAEPAHADTIATRLVRLLAPLPGAIDDGEFIRLITRALKEPLATTDPAPILARALALIAAGPDNPLLSHLLLALRRALDTHRDQVEAAVGEHSRWWIPRRVDRTIAAAILTGIDELLAELADPGSPRRAAAAAAFATLVNDLERDPAYGARLRALGAELAQDPAVQAYLAHVWRALRQQFENSAGGRGLGGGAAIHDLPARRFLAHALATAAAHLASDATLCRRLDRAAAAAARRLALPWRRQIGGFITDVVRGWDASEMVARIEAAVGHELQYIRINGTLVGALVGCLLYLVQRI